MEETQYYINFLENYLNELSPTTSFGFEKRLSEYYNNQTILITGAAGSIGRALAKCLVNFNYKKLILLDNAESALYILQQELNNIETKLIEYVIGDIRDIAKMDFVIENQKPTIIIHTAAYKQLPLMENFPYEVIKLNILATKTLADLAIKHHVEKFTFISTDKAVNPKSIMGITKRIAEQYISQLDKSKTSFCITRFGNVLGSNGSAIPLFIEQIKNNQSINITHKDVARYFISIGKVSRLILEASAMTFDNATFAFKMGNPIKIIDIAKMLILHSKRDNININVIGLHKGEKIIEKLISDHEVLKETNHGDIGLVTSSLKIKDIDSKIADLSKVKPNTSQEEIIIKISAFFQISTIK